MPYVKDVNANLKKIFDNDTVIDVLLDWEEVLDQLDIYAYKNWFKGEVVDGPHLSRYWVTATLMYPKKFMPDPEAATRLLQHGINVGFKQDIYIKPKKITSPDDLERRPERRPDDPEDGGALGHGKRRPKLLKLPVWLVKIQMPRHFVDEFNVENITVNGEEIDLADVTDAYDEKLDSESAVKEPEEVQNA